MSRVLGFVGVGLSFGCWCRLAHVVAIFLLLGCGGMVGDGFSSRGRFHLAGIVDIFLFPGCGDFPLLSGVRYFALFVFGGSGVLSHGADSLFLLMVENVVISETNDLVHYVFASWYRRWRYIACSR